MPLKYEEYSPGNTVLEIYIYKFPMVVLKNKKTFSINYDMFQFYLYLFLGYLNYLNA